MKNFNDISSVYFLGIGGIGMSALARYFNSSGISVSGYDRTPSPLTDTLQEEGIKIHFEDDVELLNKDADLVVYTPAMPADHNQMNWYTDNGFTLYKRSQILGFISQNHFCIAVAGSHGKTTISSMIAHLLNQGEGCTAFLGGIASNYESNFINTSAKYMVVEADEFDRSFLTLKPNIAVISSIDSDHLEIYGSLENVEKEFISFANKIEEDGTLILNENYKHIESKLPKVLKVKNYGYDVSNEFRLANFSVRSGLFHFNIDHLNRKIEDLVAQFGGIHNLENATAAVGVCRMLGMHIDDIRTGLLTFKGIKRRFEKHVDNANYIYIDDYAHHPKEIKALLKSIKFLFPKKEIVALFQPHLFSRTKDLAKEFASELDVADEVYLLPIYPARELPMKGVTASLILDELSTANKALINKDEVLALFKEKQNKVLLTIGAGDIDRLVKPISNLLNE